MNEKSSKRREWVKSAAIVFLSVLLVLTFFSQTIMNRSLPEVATKFVQNGTITSKIRGQGTVESGDPYTIEVANGFVGRKVTSIAFRVGDKVKKGDVLMVLADGDGAELTEAKEALAMAESNLKDAQSRYDDAILKADISNDDINTSKGKFNASTYRQMITEKQAQLKAAQEKTAALKKACSDLEKAIEDCRQQISYENEQNSYASARLTTAQTAQSQAQAAKDEAQTQADAAQAAVDAIQQESEALEAAYEATPEDFEDIEASRSEIAARLEAANKTLTEKQTALTNATAALEKADQEVANAIAGQDARDASPVVNNLNKLISEYSLQLYGKTKEKNDADAEESRIQDELNELISIIGDVSTLQSLQDAINSAKATVNDKKKLVEELQKENGGTEITSDISGTIMSINVSSGKKISDPNVMILQPEGQGFYMTMTVTNEQARLVSVGDKASLVNSWYYNDMDITLQSIKPDKTNPSKNKMLTFVVDGEVTTGQSLNISVGQKSQNYDCVVPLSALRNDTNGDYVLIVESKSTPLGNRYIATRVDVTVIAQDDTQAAVSGALNGWGDYVITTASAPIKAGDQVRMTDN